jgi:hypothetical protein
MVEQHPGSAEHGLHAAAELDVPVAILGEFADQGPVFLEADDGESAGGGRVGRGTKTERPGPVGKLFYFINLSRNANVFVDELGGLLGGDAVF